MTCIAVAMVHCNAKSAATWCGLLCNRCCAFADVAADGAVDSTRDGQKTQGVHSTGDHTLACHTPPVCGDHIKLVLMQ